MATGAAVLFVVAIAVVVVLEWRSLTPDKPGAYFSDDDGAHFFADDPRRVTPFDHKGKQAVRAHVLRGADGKLFVGYLERNTPAAGEIMRRVQQRKAGGAPPTPAGKGTGVGGEEYKKPGGAGGGPAGGAEAARTNARTAPQGSAGGGVGAGGRGARRPPAVTAPDGSPVVEVE